MPDGAIVLPDTAAAPKDYKLVGTQEIQLKSVRALIDGSGAASSFLPTLQLLDPNGHVCWEGPANSTVAAGASADVSWFPGLSKGSSSTTQTGALPWLFVTRAPANNIATFGAFTEIDLNPALASVSWASSDTSIMTLADTGDGTFGPSFLTDGMFVVLVDVDMRVNLAPGAGTGGEAQFHGGITYQVETPFVSPFMADMGGGTPWISTPSCGSIVNLDPGSQSPPVTLSLRAAQNSTHTTFQVIVSLLAYRLNPTGSGNF